MRFILIFVTLVLGLCDAARRTTTAASTAAAFGGRQLAQNRGQSQGNVWDLVELQKLDKQQDFWSQEPSVNTTESEDASALSGRQNYPLLPSPGDTNELPGPIATPTPAPIQPPPGCYGLRGQFPSPKSCVNYLNCWDGVVIEQSCPDGLLFNAVNLVCDYDYNVNCGGRPLPTPKPSLPTGSKLCPESNGRYRSATNCSEFYVCVFGRPVKFGCPRGLVYNDLLGVCDYQYNVDCKGAATPAPPTPSGSNSPLTQPPPLPQSQTYGPVPSYEPSPPQQPPSYGQLGPPSQPPQPSSYPVNPWLNTRTNRDPWYQELKMNRDDESLINGQQQPPEAVQNPWNTVQNIPASLVSVPCENGIVHRLNDACTNVVVCRNGHPQLVQCSSGLMYDIPSESCQPPSVAKC
ncbi:uncharacterized protein LOC143344495 [Colletes latitarsis]|uniref:uncharacterized protein LOC143344495 n=1 Tax=Colletes latitarsis TaxID=2605962 RepID=UPI0040359EAE